MQKGQTPEDQPNEWVRKTLQSGQMAMCICKRIPSRKECMCVHLCLTMYWFWSTPPSHFYWFKERRSGTAAREPPHAVQNLLFFPPFSISLQESMCKLIHSAVLPNCKVSLQTKQVNISDATAEMSSPIERRNAECKLLWGGIRFRNDYDVCFVCLDSPNTWSLVTDRKQSHWNLIRALRIADTVD